MALSDVIEPIVEDDHKIVIRPTEVADTRTCDHTKVTKAELLEASKHHIADVQRAMDFFSRLIQQAGEQHDHDKLTNIDEFFHDFQEGFVKPRWLENHHVVNRHHLNEPTGIPTDVNLIDVLEMIGDCVMAGMGRSGSVRSLEIDPDVLMQAFKNTAEQLARRVEVSE